MAAWESSTRRLKNESDSIEVKLLLGREIIPRWHWGLNLSDRTDHGRHPRITRSKITGGVSTTPWSTSAALSPSAGPETECGVVDTHGHRGRFDNNFFFVGPSFQYRPTEQIHVDFAPLAGIGYENPSFRMYLVLGYEF